MLFVGWRRRTGQKSSNDRGARTGSQSARLPDEDKGTSKTAFLPKIKIEKMNLVFNWVKMSVSRSVIFGPTPGVAIVFDRNNPPKSSMTQ